MLKTFFIAMVLISPTLPAAMPSGEINTLSTTYDNQARYQYSENDVKSFIYQWFAAFDHQREAGFFLNRISPKAQMSYPDFQINSQADFLRWYKGVTDSIVWSSHHLRKLEVSGSQTQGWQVNLIVNWKAKSRNQESYDLDVKQTLKIIRVGDLLKIVYLKAEL